MSNRIKIKSKKEAKRRGRKRALRTTSASRDSIRAGRRFYGQGLGK